MIGIRTIMKGHTTVADDVVSDPKDGTQLKRTLPTGQDLLTFLHRGVAESRAYLWICSS